MELKLSIRERILLIGILTPISSSAALRKVINDMISFLSLSEEEIKLTQYTEEMVQGGFSFKYLSCNDSFKQITISETLVEKIADELIKIDKAEKINNENFMLYSYFEEAIQRKVGGKT